MYKIEVWSEGVREEHLAESHIITDQFFVPGPKGMQAVKMGVPRLEIHLCDDQGAVVYGDFSKVSYRLGNDYIALAKEQQRVDTAEGGVVKLAEQK